MKADLLENRKSVFLLWRPQLVNPSPKLIIGIFQPGNPPTLANRREFALALQPGHADLWGIAASNCGLIEGQVYHYWFEVSDSSPTRDGSRIACTDPAALTVDWRLLSPRLAAPHIADDQDPASVIKFQNGKLIPCDPAGETFEPAPMVDPDQSAPNNRTVIYELPTSWARMDPQGDPQIGVGTFRDVMALVDDAAQAANFAGQPALEPGRSHLVELGINALELLPLADSFVNREKIG